MTVFNICNRLGTVRCENGYKCEKFTNVHGGYGQTQTNIRCDKAASTVEKNKQLSVKFLAILIQNKQNKYFANRLGAVKCENGYTCGDFHKYVKNHLVLCDITSKLRSHTKKRHM